MSSTVFWLLLISLTINGAMFLLAFCRQSDKLTDASYAATFITLTLVAYGQTSRDAYQLLGAALVCIWALRIGGFLLYRVMRAGKDRRFDGVREHFWQFGRFWLGQAVTVWALLLPVFLMQPQTSLRHGGIIIGGVLWLMGLVIEAVADLQKYRFSQEPAQRGQWIDSGLWRYSRHPNYFGEILVWVGIYLYAWPSLTTAGRFVGSLSPLLISTLLLFVSGIPPLEKGADRRWGDQPTYQAYKRSTSLLVPLPKRRLRGGQ